MTAKKFTLIEFLPNVIRIEDRGRKLEGQEIVDLLNRLFNENEQLKQSNELLADMADKYKELRDSLEEENEQLKSENRLLKGKLHRLRMEKGRMEEEIECLSEETIEKFKQDLQDGNFIEFTAR